MKIFETEAELALSLLTTGQLVRTKGSATSTDGGTTLYQILATGEGVTLANGNVAVPYVVTTNANLIINGGFDFFERPPPYVGKVYGPDHWAAFSSAQTVTQIDAPDDLPFSSAASIVRSNDGSKAQYQPVELPVVGSPDKYIVGSTWTLSVYLWAEVSIQPVIIIDFSDDIDGTNAVSVASTSSPDALPTQVWTRVELPFTIGASPVSTSEILRIRAGVATTTANEEMRMGGAKLETGLVATPFTRASNTLAGEKAALQRYYVRADDIVARRWRTGSGVVTSGRDGPLLFPATMRTDNPDITLTDPTDSNLLNITVSGSDITRDGFTVSYDEDAINTITTIAYGYTADAEFN